MCRSRGMYSALQSYWTKLLFVNYKDKPDHLTDCLINVQYEDLMMLISAGSN